MKIHSILKIRGLDKEIQPDRSSNGTKKIFLINKWYNPLETLSLIYLNNIASNNIKKKHVFKNSGKD